MKIVKNGNQKIGYHYDELNRLVREDNYFSYETSVYTYDVNGDILSKDSYWYTTGTI
ncbi:MAG: hypothetical protein IK085_05190 [Clostridia bacterium]|nr:hypothetical protein [Clostridia bacterium]